jgi:hypothetical protein
MPKTLGGLKMKMRNRKSFLFATFLILFLLCSVVMAQDAAGSEDFTNDKGLTMVEPGLRPRTIVIDASKTNFTASRFVRQQEARVPGADTYLLKEGTDVILKFAQDLSSKTAQEDDRVNFELAEDLKVGDVIIAKIGTKAVGTVTHAKKSGMFGKGGELNVRLEYLKVGDLRVRLRGNKGKEGSDKTGTAVALTVLFGPIGLIKHGKNVEVKTGAPLKAFVDEDIRLPADNQAPVDKKVVP